MDEPEYVTEFPQNYLWLIIIMDFSRITLGSAQFGMQYGATNGSGKPEICEVRRILGIAKDNGIERIDTATNYGVAEETLGAIGVHDFEITSKLPGYMAKYGPIDQWINSQVLGSLRRLKLNQIDTLLLHEPLDLLSELGNKIFDCLKFFKANRVIKKIGISVYDTEVVYEILDNFDIDVVQAPFNLVDRRFVRSGLTKDLKDRNIEFHARSIFLQGVLLQDIDSIPKQLSLAEPKLRKWATLTKDENSDRLNICLNYVLANKNIDQAIIGVDTAWQLQELINQKVSKNQNDKYDWLESTVEKVIDPRLWRNSR